MNSLVFFNTHCSSHLPSACTASNIIQLSFNTPALITRRQYSAPAKKVVIIHSIGVDRPGIISDITRIVTDKGGNVGESRAQLLGGHFSLMMQVDIAEKDAAGLQDLLASGVEGMKTECLESLETNAAVAPVIACK